jgi:N-acetylglucosamine-6-phosphate deacetylase
MVSSPRLYGERGFLNRRLIFKQSLEGEVLKAVTIYPAQIIGVDKLLGSIEVGKMANLIVTDGDPLEFKTNVKHMFINGKPVDLSSRHTRLYDKFKDRP